MKLNRRIVITGASSGIGKIACEYFLNIGCEVIGLSRNNLQLSHNNFRSFNCDITNAESFEKLKLEPEAKKRVDTLINCAGLTLPAIGIQSVDDFQQTLDVNLVGAYRVITHFLPNLKESSSGSIINVASIGGITGFGGNPAYGASKAALINLTKSLAVDLSPFGIRVNSVSPGYFRTKMTDKSFKDPYLKKVRENNTILGRFGEPEELMGTFEFLTSVSSSYITGQNIVVDGGWISKGMVQ